MDSTASTQLISSTQHVWSPVCARSLVCFFRILSAFQHFCLGECVCLSVFSSDGCVSDTHLREFLSDVIVFEFIVINLIDAT